MIIYNIEKYCEEFKMSKRAFFYRQRRGILPTSHHIYSLSTRSKIIVIEDDCKWCKAAIEYHQKSQNTSDKWQCAMEFCVKYDLEVKRFCKTIGI
jgi:hypothetical protein